MSNHGYDTPSKLVSAFFLFYNLHCFSVFSHPETDLMYAAKVYRDDRMRKKAELMTMDNCRELDRLNSLFRGG